MPDSYFFSNLNTELAQIIYGPQARHLKFLEKEFNVKIKQKGTELKFQGTKADILKVQKVLDSLHKLAYEGINLNLDDVNLAVRAHIQNTDSSLISLLSEHLFTSSKGKRISPKNVSQKEYIEAIKKNDLVFGLGPAGTGKTYLAVLMAVLALQKGEVSKLILTRPAVEAGEQLGFLPGDLAEKINPYLRPLYDALYDLIPYEKYNRLMEQNVIEIAPLAFMRGRTLNDAFIILDEAQNCTHKQLKMFLTRLGPHSKTVVTGDESQSDLAKNEDNCLLRAAEILKEIDGIAFCHFNKNDVVRHHLVRKIIEAYEKQF